MASTYSSAPRAISKETHCIAGIITTVYGLQELPEEIQEVACLWLLHPRLQTQACMEPIASSTIHEWNERQRATKRTIGLIAVSFDQRNHGTREVDTLANEAWRSGNSRHAQDMFASYRPSPTPTPSPVRCSPAKIYIPSRRNRNRHIPPPNLPPLLHPPNHNPPPRPRHLPRRPRGLALSPPRPPHHNRHHHNRLSRLRPPNERPRSPLQTPHMDLLHPSWLLIPRLQRLPHRSNRSRREIRPRRPPPRRRQIPLLRHLQPLSHTPRTPRPDPPLKIDSSKQTHPQPRRRRRQTRPLQMQRTLPALAQNRHSTNRLFQRRQRRARRHNFRWRRPRNERWYGKRSSSIRMPDTRPIIIIAARIREEEE